MPSRANYRGDHVDELVAQGESGHLFGPDICGVGVGNDEDIANACRLGMTDVVRRAATQTLGSGAHYELVAATYDAETDLTTADFRPHVNPLHRTRYHGGTGQPSNEPPRLAQHDNIQGR